MAKFKMELPNDIIKQLEKVANSNMLEEMTEAGAEVVYNNIKANMQSAFKDTSRLEKCLVKTRSYKTPSDDGVNTKVAFYGYFTNENGVVVPAPLVVQAREYGTSKGEAKKPFIRKAFKKAQITQAMLEVQKRYIDNE